MRRGLRSRLALTHVGVAFLAIALVAAIVAVTGDRRFSSYAAHTQQQATDSVIRAIENAYRTDGGWDEVSVINLGRLAQLNGLRIAVFDAEGELLFATPGPRSGHRMGRMGGMEKREAPEGWATRRVPVTIEDRTVATALVYEQQASSLPLNSAFRRDVLLYLALAGGVAGAASLVVGILASRRITRPLERLTAAADAIAHGHREVRVQEGGADEVGNLAMSFNMMSEALGRQEQWRRSMTADLAHELRTPLATIQARVEALEDGVLPVTPENLRVIGEEVERLGRLLGTLRSLDELDAGRVGLDLRPLDLGALVADVADTVRDQLRRADVELKVEVLPVLIEGDADRLRQALTNLVDNSRKFTPPGGHIDLRVWADTTARPPMAHVSVRDDGVGIADEDLPHVFERFYRGRDAATSEGAGLGLAIARRLIESHRGTISVESALGLGSAFTVSLPRMTDSSL